MGFIFEGYGTNRTEIGVALANIDRIWFQTLYLKYDDDSKWRGLNLFNWSAVDFLTGLLTSTACKENKS